MSPMRISRCVCIANTTAQIVAPQAVMGTSFRLLLRRGSAQPTFMWQSEGSVSMGLVEGSCMMGAVKGAAQMRRPTTGPVDPG